MPPRWLCSLIVLFWLATSGWLFWRDLLPQALPGQPPAYTIDLVEETQTQRPFTHWTIFQDGRRALLARLQVGHPDRDHFELTARYEPPLRQPGVALDGALLEKMTSTYRVNSSGDLLGIDVRMEGARLPTDQLLRGRVTIVDGQVIDGRLRLGQTVEWIGGLEPRIALPDVPAARRGAVLMPLHPVKRLGGLSPGQSWHMTILDPLAALRGVGVKTVFARAEVRPETQDYTHGRYQDVPCLVIDCEGDDLQTSIWVRAHDGLVLCQEAALGKTRWTMYRD